MDDDQVKVARRDAFLREMERKSLDTLMVFNPTDKDYLLEWDKRYHRIPAKNKNMGFGNGKMELSRYLSEKYAREMKNYIINEAADDFMEKFRKEREAKGQRFRDKFEENAEALPLIPKTNQPDKIKEIYDTIILGVVREYGMDAPEVQPGEAIDDKTPEERVLENMNRPYQEEEQPEIAGRPQISTPDEGAPRTPPPKPKAKSEKVTEAVRGVSQ